MTTASNIIKIQHGIIVAAAIINPIMMVAVIIKICRVTSHKINKCYSRLSLWMLIQLFIGMLGCFTFSIGYLYPKVEYNVLGKEGFKIFRVVCYFFIDL